MDSRMQECINECLSCYSLCAETTTYCLTTGGQHAGAGHIGLMLDCAKICQTSADFMIRGSEQHVYTCHACAEICDACARSCERLANDPRMSLCMDECRRCAEMCRSMSAMPV